MEGGMRKKEGRRDGGRERREGGREGGREKEGGELRLDTYRGGG